MVFVLDEGSVFKAPLNKVWQLAQSEGIHVHADQINPKRSMEGQSVIVGFHSKMPDGQLVQNKIRLTPFPPVGFSLEYLEGPMAGSKMMQHYLPKGNETGVTCAGEFTSQFMQGEQLKQAVLQNLETAFNEDQENLKKL